MNTYQILRHPVIGLQAVKQGWSWPGFFFTWIWAFSKGLNVYGIGILAAALLSLAFGTFASFVVGILAGLWMGSEGNAFVINNLLKLGYQPDEFIKATSPEAALTQLVANSTSQEANET